MVVQVQYNFARGQVAGYLKDVPQGMKRATSRAMNSLNPDIREDATKGVTSVYNLQAKDVKRNIKLIRRSGPNSLFVVWKAEGGPIPLNRYSPKGGLPLGKRVPVTVDVKNGRRVVKGGFIGPNGHIFRRDGGITQSGKGRIVKRWGPTIQSAFIKDKVTDSLVRLTNKLLPRRVESEMVRELRKIRTGTLPKP